MKIRCEITSSRPTSAAASGSCGGQNRVMPQPASSLSPHVLPIELPFEARRRGKKTERSHSASLLHTPVNQSMCACKCTREKFASARMFLFAGVFSASLSGRPQGYSKEKCFLQSAAGFCLFFFAYICVLA